MKLIKLTALSSILLVFFLSFNSCEKDTDLKKVLEYSKKGIVMTGAQETPPTAATALGSFDVLYSKETKILSYTVKWSGLTGNVTAFHIHGQAPTGFVAAVFQTFVLTSIIPCTPGSVTSCGSYSGTLLIDGVSIKEQDLINGFYYINIHTAAFPNGEIRGQIRFQ